MNLSILSTRIVLPGPQAGNRVSIPGFKGSGNGDIADVVVIVVVICKDTIFTERSVAVDQSR